MQRIGGFRRKTRHKLKKNVRDAGKLSIKNYLTKFKEGDKVILKAEPAYQEGMYFPRYHGKSGVITGTQGKSYYVKIRDQNKYKVLLVHPVHLKKD